MHNGSFVKGDGIVLELAGDCVTKGAMVIQGWFVTDLVVCGCTVTGFNVAGAGVAGCAVIGDCVAGSESVGRIRISAQFTKVS